MAKINSNKVFASTLKGVTGSMTKVRTDVQACLVYAFDQYATHGNTTFMNRVRAAASTSKALPCKAIEDYVQAYANVTYKDKKFTSKNSKDRQVKALDSKWFDTINIDEAPSTPKQTDILKMVKSLSKQIDKKAENNLLTDNDKQVAAAEEMLAAMVSKLEALGFTTAAK